MHISQLTETLHFPELLLFGWWFSALYLTGILFRPWLRGQTDRLIKYGCRAAQLESSHSIRPCLKILSLIWASGIERPTELKKESSFLFCSFDNTVESL